MAMIDINWKPPPRDLRVFSVGFLVFVSALAAYLHWRHGVSLGTCTILWSVAGAIGVLGLAVPRAVLPVFIVLMVVALPIGWVVSHVLLALIYYGMVTPIGLLMRGLGHDPMGRAFDPDAKTYWVERKPVDDTRRYFRQF
jgi:hypothetical protein